MMQTRILILIVILISALSCKIDRKGLIDRDKFTFRMPEDNFMFFKNVRQIYYDVTDLPKAHWIAFRFSDRYQGAERPALTPVIVVDWYKNEAYLLVETNVLLQDEESLVIQEKNNANNRLYEYSLKERGRENMLEFATKIYEGIMANHDVFVRYKENQHSLFANDEERDHFRVVMADYYRLTNIFKP